MKWYEHLFIYLGCVAFTELIIAGLCLLAQFSGHNVWYMFAWLQLVIPFAALVLPFLMVEAFISADNERKAQEEWCKRVNQMLKEYEKENKANESDNN